MRPSAVCVCLAVVLATVGGQQDCSRQPKNQFGRTPPKTHGSRGYKIVISGNHTKYAPGKTYTVKLVGPLLKMSWQMFYGFYLVVEPAARVEYGLGQRVGRFQLFGEALSRFSDTCDNMVTHTSLTPKSEVTVMWRAPPAGSGCVLFRATIVERRDVWFMDDGPLTRELCEEVQENMDEQPPPLKECCACHEAKYEVTFEGLWSRHTHPKDFPQNERETAFSDIIGASHTADFRFWEYDAPASQGVRQVAEWGTTKKLESELKKHSRHIRTIIKARGLRHPNQQGSTFAVFRVDKRHHQASLISRMSPSPDWLVGVSAMELCRPNCSWTERQVLNLRPWDAGTKNGVSYSSRMGSATIPQQNVRLITSKWPVNSPFYEPSGGEVAPVARLVIQRQRVYYRACPAGGRMATAAAYGAGRSTAAAYGAGRSTAAAYGAGRSTAACATTSWGAWSVCSVSCGDGVKSRRRRYRNSVLRQVRGCNVRLQQQELCRAPDVCGSAGYGGGAAPYGMVAAGEPADCSLTEWSRWTPCSATCGGTRTRSRSYRSRYGRKHCPQLTQEQQPCVGGQPACAAPELMPAGCEVTPWSEWSPCSVTCGQEGVQVRSRMLLSEPASRRRCTAPLKEHMVCRPNRLDCRVALEEARVICNQPQDVGLCREDFERWYYNAQQGFCVKFVYDGCRGNRNNFRTYAECNEVCEKVFAGGGERRPGEFDAPYAAPPPYDGGAAEADVYGTHREYGVPAPAEQQLLGSLDYGRQVDDLLGSAQVINPLVASHSRAAHADCPVSAWSRWSACSASCGSGRQERRRRPLREHHSCGRRRLVRHRECGSLPPC